MGECNNEFLDVVIGLLSVLLVVSEWLSVNKNCTCNGIIHALFPSCVDESKIIEQQAVVVKEHIKEVLTEINEFRATATPMVEDGVILPDVVADVVTEDI